MSTPIFSKSDRLNTISNRKLVMTITVLTKKSNMEKMTLGEIKKIKKEISSSINKITPKHVIDNIQKEITTRKDIVVRVTFETYSRRY